MESGSRHAFAVAEATAARAIAVCSWLGAGLGSAGVMAGPDDPTGPFRPEQFCD